MDSMRSNLNTILLTITLSVLGWIAFTVHTTAVTVAAMNERMIASDRELVETRARVSALERDMNDVKVTAALGMNPGPGRRGPSSP